MTSAERREVVLRQGNTRIVAVGHNPSPVLSRREVEARVKVARDEAIAWAASATNAATIGAYLDAFTAAWRSAGSRVGPLPADYLVLLREWDVPGITAPAGVHATLAEQWSRSVTVSLLRVLRRQGHMT